MAEESPARWEKIRRASLDVRAAALSIGFQADADLNFSIVTAVRRRKKGLGSESQLRQ